MAGVINRKAKLLENIAKLMERDSFNDVRIRLSNGVQVEANKVILCAMSDFFEYKIQEKQKSRKGDEKILEIDLDISSTKEMLESVKKFLYTGIMDCETLKLKDFLELIHLSLFMKLHELVEAVESLTLTMINDGGFSLKKILKLSSTAEAYGLNKVVSSMLNYLDENISDVSKLPEVQFLSSDFLSQLLDYKSKSFMLMHDHFRPNDSGSQQSFSSFHADEDGSERNSGSINNERLFPRFVTLTSWLSGKSDVDEVLKTKLISMFDLKRFTNQQLTTTVRESRLFSESSILDVVSQSVQNLELKLEKLEEDKMSNKRKFEEKKNPLMIQEILDSINGENKKLRVKAAPSPGPAQGNFVKKSSCLSFSELYQRQKQKQ